LIFIVFITSGVVVHDLFISLVTGSLCIIFTVTFTLYSIIFSIEERIASRRKKRLPYRSQARPIPIYYFVMLNMLLLSLPLVMGILVNYYALPDSAINNLFR
jgi:polyferredoxin